MIWFFNKYFIKKDSKLVLSIACRFTLKKREKRAFNVCVSLFIFFSSLLYFNLFFFYIKLLNCHSVRLIPYNQVSDLLFSLLPPKSRRKEIASVDGHQRRCGFEWLDCLGLGQTMYPVFQKRIGDVNQVRSNVGRMWKRMTRALKRERETIKTNICDRLGWVTHTRIKNNQDMI